MLNNQFKSFADLFAAFKNGTKFQVVFKPAQGSDTSGWRVPVSTMSLRGYATGVMVTDASGRAYISFRLDGTNPKVPGATLEVVEEVKSSPLAAALANKIDSLSKAGTATTVQRAQPAAKPMSATGSVSVVNNIPKDEPFLRRFLAGKPFHVPKTGDVVEKVEFTLGVLEVHLRNPVTGKRRVTPRYNHEGKHKFRPERSLVEGAPPKPMKDVRVTLYKHAANGGLFAVRDGEVVPNIRGFNNATVVGYTTIKEPA